VVVLELAGLDRPYVVSNDCQPGGEHLDGAVLDGEVFGDTGFASCVARTGNSGHLKIKFWPSSSNIINVLFGSK
jgi:hypothetical protein